MQSCRAVFCLALYTMRAKSAKRDRRPQQKTCAVRPRTPWQLHNARQAPGKLVFPRSATCGRPAAPTTPRMAPSILCDGLQLSMNPGATQVVPRLLVASNAWLCIPAYRRRVRSKAWVCGTHVSVCEHSDGGRPGQRSPNVWSHSVAPCGTHNISVASDPSV